MTDAEHDTVFDLRTTLGRDYAAVDWAATTIGPPHTWPQSLRATVRTMLGVRFAIWVGWGPDLAFFCNDAYRHDTLGTKYPWALGRPTREVWSEIWDEIAPMFEAVVQRGESLRFEALQLFLERDGYAEETYHTFSYSPLHDDDGSVGGLFCVVSEDTAMVISGRRIAALRDLAGDLTDARSEADVLETISRSLGGADRDLPFVAAYLVDEPDDTQTEGPETARLAFTAGVDAGHPAAPHLIRRGEPGWGMFWPADGTSHVVERLGERFPDLPTGAWARPPERGLTVALTEADSDRPAGFLVVGVNPHRVLDAEYVGFVELVAGQVGAALARARAFDAERTRAEQIAELDRAKTTFFTNVSHELRTPLTLLLGPAADALDDTAHPLDDTQRARLEVVARNGERLLKLVNTLLDFSRLESGRTEVQLEPTDLAALTTELTGMFEAAYTRAGLDLEVESVPLPGTVQVDREMWSKIVFNLLSNALKATFTGGVRVRLAPAGPAADRSVELSVTDTGIGIPPAEQERLFERFHRVAGAELRTHEGSGIGLALVAELAALHGGAATVRSELGAGSTFTVTIPTGTPPVHEDVRPGPARSLTPHRIGAGYLAEALRWLDPDGAGSGPDPHGDRLPDDGVPEPSVGPRVLVVDDNADMRDYVSGVLRTAYRVTSVADGAQALEAARAEPPDLVLTDIMMPVLDGFGLLEALRADPTTMHIPVVMLSARSGSEAAVEGLEAGADDYLVKPFSQRELIARVRANLELDRVRRVADELERSRAMLAYAEEVALVGSFDYDIAADRLAATPQYLNLFDLGPGRADTHVNALQATLARIHPDDRERAERAAQQSFTTGAPLDLEFRVGERVIWLRATVQRGPDGVPARIRGSAQDVTAQRHAEAAERAAAAAQVVADRESAIARELQDSLLPADTFDADHLDIAGYYRAGVEGTQVGGDWYDVISLDAGRTALVLGDVMGRGVRAAAVMGQLRATVRAYSRLELAPDTVLHLLDDAVRDIGRDTIVTCVYALYDPSDHTLTYANAGHLPPLLSRPGAPVVRLTAGGPPLGTGRAWGKPETVTLPAGSTIALYTDGLVERRGDDIDDGIAALERLLDRPVEDVAALPERFTRELLPAGHDDDVAILVARVSERASADRSEARAFDSDVSVVGSAREWTGVVLRDWGIPGPLIDDSQLIVSELVTNAIVHGNPPVEMRLRLGGARLLIEVLDSAVTTPQLRHAKETDDHGRGLLIVSMLSEAWGTRPTPNGKSVWCHIRTRTE